MSKRIPSSIVQIAAIRNLELDFIDSVNIPDEIKIMNISRLILSGKINTEKKDRIKKLLPNTFSTLRTLKQ